MWDGGTFVAVEFMLHEDDEQNRAQWTADYELLKKFKKTVYPFYLIHHTRFHEPNLRKANFYQSNAANFGFSSMDVLKRENFYCAFVMRK